MKKNKLENLVPDIYKIIEVLADDKVIDIPEEAYESFGKDMTEALRGWATPMVRPKNGLRMSNIGRPLKRLWYDLKSENSTPERINAPTYIKFLYGHLLEVLLLFFVKLTGHVVEAEQKEISVSGIKGHMDCKIDGEVIDIKTASGYSFRKFKEGTLAQSDSFGYLSQLAGYEEAEKTSNGGFLVMNKETGELTTFIPDDLDKPNIVYKIKEVKKAISLDYPPEFCYYPVPEGVSGNMKLPRDCTYCPHKFECHKDANDGVGLRAFKYAKGIVYLTKVEKLPNVQEIA
jgi:hypothetical protein|tara:strand:- start:117 stop:980 length:864 start_codon:yes stop_codon:yes gene_type:complete